jgi:hypothetical protein
MIYFAEDSFYGSIVNDNGTGAYLTSITEGAQIHVTNA